MAQENLKFTHQEWYNDTNKAPMSGIFEILYPKEFEASLKLLIEKEIPEMRDAIFKAINDFEFDCEINFDIANDQYLSDCCIEVTIYDDTWTSYLSVGSNNEAKMTPIFNSGYSFSEMFVQTFANDALNYYLQHQEERLKFIFTIPYLQRVLTEEELIQAYAITKYIELLPEEVRETFLF